MKMTVDVDGAPVPRLDSIPLADAAEFLGITTSELEDLIEQGFELTGFDGMNGELITPAELAEECKITTRQIRNLEERGLPSVGSYRAKRYPWPLAEAWVRIFRLRIEHYRGSSLRLDGLDPRDAMQEWNDHIAVARAYAHLRYPERATRLDRAAKAKLEEAQRLLDAGRVPLSWQWD